MRLTHQEFQDLVLQALEEVPPKIGNALQNVAILVEDWPMEEELDAAGVDARHHLFGLYTGVPLPEREGGPPPLPDTITLFKRPIESACSSRQEVVHEVKVTVLHEVGHYLGMGEDDLERLGYS